MKHLLYSLSLISLLLAIHRNGEADRYSIQKIPLPSSKQSIIVRDIAVGSDERVWVATWGEGLFVYDGYNFQQFTTENSTIADNWIRALEPDGKDGYWIGTRTGISHYNGNTFLNFTSNTTPVFSNPSIFTITRLKNGAVWFGAQGGFIYEWSSEEPPVHPSSEPSAETRSALSEAAAAQNPYWINLELPEGLTSPKFADIRDITETQDGSIWVIAQGVWQWKDGEWLSHSPRIEKRLRSITELNDGSLFLAGLHGGKRFQHGFWNTLTDLPCLSVLDGNEGTLLLGTRHGLYSLQHNHAEPILIGQNIPTAEIHCLYPDPHNQVWIGANNGLYLMRKDPYQLFSQSPEGNRLLGCAFDLQQHHPPIVMDETHKIFTVSGPNLDLLGSLPGGQEHFLSLSNIVQDTVWILYEQSTFLFSLQHQTVLQEAHHDRLLSSHKLFSTTTGNTYNLTKQGVFQWMDGDWRQPRPWDQEPLQASAIDLCEAADQSLWIGFDTFIAHWDGSSLETFSIPLQPTDYEIFRIVSMTVDPAGDLWVGTSNNGIYRYSKDTGEWIHFTESSGLISDQISSLFVGSNSALWSGFISGGISAIHLDREGQTHSISSLLSHGNQPVHRVSIFGEYPNHTLWHFSTGSGLTAYPLDQSPPETMILTHREDGEFGKPIYIRYSGIDYQMRTPQEQLLYSWRIVDAENGSVVSPWTRFLRTTDASIDLSQSGTFQIEVRCADFENNIDPSPASQTITVLPLPFYEHVWFYYGFIAAFFLTILIGVRLYSIAYQYKRSAILDGLTGLVNKRHFELEFEREWRRALRSSSPISVILCDIDYFKEYNDAHGHIAGDQCLQMIGTTLKNTIQRAADIVARYGGEEFVVVLPGTPIEQAEHVAEKIRGNVLGTQIPHRTSRCSDHVTLSAGVACVIPTELTTREQLLHHADLALYQAKQSGRNRVCIFSLSLPINLTSPA